MNLQNFLSFKLHILIPILLLLASCAAGDAQFTPENEAGFWYGLWHGVISVISMIIHIFNDSVAVYEIDNTGGWYDFGFLLGVISIWGGGSHMSCKSAADKKHDKEWDEISNKVEIKVMRKLKAWAEDEEQADSGEEWEEIGEKVEKKLKRKIREWAEKE
ncbi:MAG: hypothetical protein ABFS08_06805 [Pseudomonadota bacterium]